MRPTLVDGDHVLVAPCTRAEVGEIVLCEHPFRLNTRIIKRVSAADDGGMFLTGDNVTESTDSASFGAVPWSRLIGRICTRM